MPKSSSPTFIPALRRARRLAIAEPDASMSVRSLSSICRWWWGIPAASSAATTPCANCVRRGGGP